MFKATFGQKLKYFINAGPYAGVLLSRIYEREAGEINSAMKFKSTATFKPVDFGIAAGLGVKYPISDQININLEVRQNSGFLNISKFRLIDDKPINTSATNLLIGVSYGFGNNTSKTEEIAEQ